MKIYDISQEVFGCAVYPGDPKPEKEIKLKISEGAVCNLSAFSMCAHNGTHVDAPLHFIDGGKKHHGGGCRTDPENSRGKGSAGCGEDPGRREGDRDGGGGKSLRGQENQTVRQ